jgi:hypothetical protein
MSLVQKELYNLAFIKQLYQFTHAAELGVDGLSFLSLECAEENRIPKANTLFPSGD